MSRTKIVLALVLVVFFNMNCTKKVAPPKQVNLAIWGNYISPELIEKFTKESKIKVNVSNYTSNEELLAKIQAGGSGIDVAVPSDYMVEIMVKLKLLNELELFKIPNMGLISKEFLALAYDPQNQYSLPYSWTTAGIAVNRDLYKGKIKKWKDVLENSELNGKISLMDDVREVTAAALKMNGFSVNTTKKEELEKAEKALLKAKSKVKMFRSDVIDALVNKEVAVAHAYSSDALQAAQSSNGKIEYILPEDGGTKATDNLVIIKGAKNVEEAHVLINFMLSPESNLSFVTNVLGGPVLKSTKESLPESLKNNAALFPSTAVLSKFESIIDLGENTKLYEEIWTKVKTN